MEQAAEMSAIWFGADVPCTLYNCCCCVCVREFICCRSMLLCIAGCTPCCGTRCESVASLCPNPALIYQSEARSPVPATAAPAPIEMTRQFFVL